MSPTLATESRPPEVHAQDGFRVTGLGSRAWAPSSIDLTPGLLQASRKSATERLAAAARAAMPRNDIYARIEGPVAEFAPSARRVADTTQWHAAAQASACMDEMGFDTALSVLRQRPSEQRGMLRMLMDDRASEMRARLAPQPAPRHAMSSVPVHPSR